MDDAPPSLYNLTCFATYAHNISLKQLPSSIAMDVLPCCRFRDGMKVCEEMITAAVQHDHQSCIRNLLAYDRTNQFNWYALLAHYGSLETLIQLLPILPNTSLFLYYLIRYERLQAFKIAFNALREKSKPIEWMQHCNSIVQRVIHLERVDFLHYLFDHPNLQINESGFNCAMEVQDDILVQLVFDRIFTFCCTSRMVRILMSNLFILIHDEIFYNTVEVSFHATSSTMPQSSEEKNIFKYWQRVKYLINHSLSYVQNQAVMYYKENSKVLAMLGLSFWSYRDLLIERNNIKALEGACLGTCRETLELILPKVENYNAIKMLNNILLSARPDMYYKVLFPKERRTLAYSKWQKLYSCLLYVLDQETDKSQEYGMEEVAKLYSTAVYLEDRNLLKTFVKHGIILKHNFKHVLFDAISANNMSAVKFLHHKIEDPSLLEDCCSEAALNGNLEMLQFLHEHGYVWDENTTGNCIVSQSLPCLEFAHEHGCPWDPFYMVLNAATDKWYEGLTYLLDNHCAVPHDMAHLLPAVNIRKPSKGIHDLYA